MRYILLFGLYILSGLFLLPFYQYRINPDAISYFNIAQSYIAGTDPINGFWSPLLSWLLIPFFLFHIPPVFAFSIIQYICGFFALIAIIRILKKLHPPEKIQFLAVLFSLPLILYFTYSFVITPDFLTVCFLLFYFDAVLAKKSQSVAAAIFGGLAYFAKTYTFFFFLIHFICVMIYKKDTGGLIKGLTTFILIIIPWVTLLTLKYHHITVGNAGIYNFQTTRPGGVDNPHFYSGLLKPEVNAVSAWYDPSYLKVAYHKPSSLRYEIVGWIVIIYKNIESILFNYEGFSIFAFVALAYSATNIKKQKQGILLGTFLLFSAGYCIYHIEDRYIWFGAILLLFMIASMKVKDVFLLIMLFSFTILPIKRLLANRYNGRDVYTFSKSIHVHGAIASNGNWNESLFIAYYNNSKYYGVTKGNEKEVLASIKTNHIDYFLVWNDGKKYRFLSAQKPVQIAENIAIYSFRKRL